MVSTRHFAGIVGKGAHRLDGAVEGDTVGIGECSFAQTSYPVRRIASATQHGQAGQHLVELGMAARVGVGVTLDQAPAFQHLDAKRVIPAAFCFGELQPFAQMRRLDLVA